MLYFAKIPKLVRDYYSSYIWQVKTEEKVVYLTFDDGPTPVITEWVLEQLAEYNALATFFLIGQNVQEHPELARQVMAAGHAIGNHTQTHINGWKTDSDLYLEDVQRGWESIKANLNLETPFFRPPYGRIKPGQAKVIQKTQKIVMMDVMSGDFDTNLEGEKCLQNVIQHSSAGSIVLLHDSVKAWKRLNTILPQILEQLSAQGYRFDKLSPELFATK